MSNGDMYSGEWKDDKMHGKGSMEFAKTGDKFEGTFENGKKKNGTMTYANTDVYVGDWENEKWHGKGTLTSELGEYEGNFAAHKFEGEGTLTYPADKDQLTYAGEWKKHKRHGKGKLTFKNGKFEEYDGQWADDKMSDGKLVYRDGGVFEGQFKTNKRNGKGTMDYGKDSEFVSFDGIWADDLRKKGLLVYRSGDTFDGDFDKQELPCKGTKTFANGDSYTGNFAEGLMSGKAGVYTFEGKAEGKMVTGEFKENTCVSGEITYPDKSVYKGSLDGENLGKREGEGTYKHANGDVFKGMFVNDAISKGEMKYKDGGTYTGAFQDDKRVGEGCVMVYSDGSRFEGEFKDDVRAAGILTQKNGEKYEGTFDEEGRKHGEGNMCLKTLTFAGTFDQDAAVTGDIQYSHDYKSKDEGGRERKEYTGAVNSDFEPNGEGKMLWQNDDTYEGFFVDGAVTGEGKLTVIEKNVVYTGSFVDGVLKKGVVAYGAHDTYSSYQGEIGDEWVMEGKGLLIFKNGDKFEGDFKNDIYVMGQYTNSKGCVLDGVFNKKLWDSDDSPRQFHSGVLTFPNGDTYDGTQGSESSFVAHLDNITNQLQLESKGVVAVAETDLLKLGIWPSLPAVSDEPRLPADTTNGLQSIQDKGGESMLDSLQEARENMIEELEAMYTKAVEQLKEEESADVERRSRFEARWSVPESKTFTGEYYAKLTEMNTVLTAAKEALAVDSSQKGEVLDTFGPLKITPGEHEAAIKEAEEKDSHRTNLIELLEQQQQSIKTRTTEMEELVALTKPLDVLPALMEGGGSVSVEEVFTEECKGLQTLRDSILESVKEHKALLLNISTAHTNYQSNLDKVREGALQSVLSPLSVAVANFQTVLEKFTKANSSLNSHKDSAFASVKNQVDKYVKNRKDEAKKLANSLLVSELHQAIRDNDKEAIELLHKKEKLNFDDKGDGDMTALHLAITLGKEDLVKFLCKSGASPKLRDSNNHTMIWLAIEQKAPVSDTLIPILIDAGADPDAAEDEKTGESVMHILAKANQIDTIKLLVENKASVNTRCNEDKTPLLLACAGNATNTVHYLVENGAAPNVSDNAGNTVFHLAGESLHSYLAEHGARPGTVNKNKDKGGNPVALKAAIATFKKAPAKTATINELKEGDVKWQSNDSSPCCKLCGSKWGMLNRRHHCRSCGVLACASCTTKKCGKLRVCDGCFNKL